MSSCGNNCTSCLEPVKQGIGAQNPILAHALGICSALGVTDAVKPTVVMCLALLVVATASTFLVSLLRKLTPNRVRMIVQMLVISTLVILVELYLRAFHPAMSAKLGVYVTLIITNCLIMGRCESFALRNGPIASALDGLGASLGYGIVLLMIASLREVLGRGEFWANPVFQTAQGETFAPAGIFVLSAGAFFAMGTIVWIVRAIFPQPEPGKSHSEAQ